MPKHSRRYSEIREKVDRNALYQPEEAIHLVKELATAKFDETIETHLRMGVDPRHADQQVRGVVTLPAGTGRQVRILVFAGPDGQALAKEAGADYVGAEDLAEQIQKGWTDFDVVLATPDMMRIVGRLGRVLGPRGLMPSPKTGTILPAEDLPRVIQEARLGRVEFRVDKTGNIHAPIGKASFDDKALLKNFAALMEAIMAAKPATLKNVYVRRVTLASTMGPGVKVDPNAAMNLQLDNVS
ncbi:50S ribosomal protein L1 [Litorilinea aerophila]|uniref:Large ribosomal subunit protein uL1 n=1 Tax=Litorilinea aerophila TaxID=1204385 RepID=A0A540V8G4_9CHLR|nr:50S ribosomal protein L1 [Litorilinea aerophila]MCC9079010.1 50S ribosomal protein L1 [Litorilinea aerophila]GIV76195.1 MAG: 50S ribosomal protein L1 [Litorilinea sp.]